MHTTVRVSSEVKKKAEALKGKLSFDSYISKMNVLVEMQNIDLDDIGENIPKLIKNRTDAQIAIVRAHEKQYLKPIKGYLEVLVDQKMSKGEPIVEAVPEEGNVYDDRDELIAEIERLKAERLDTPQQEFKLDRERKNDLLRQLNELEQKGELRQKGNDHEMVYASFFFKQKLGIIINKINAL